MRIAFFLPAILLAAGDAQDDAKALQGVWSVTAYMNSGTTLKEKELKTLKVAIKDNTFVIQLGREQADKFSFTIDPKKNPKWITLTPSDPKQQTMPGIYEIKDDTVTICMKLSGNIRPKTFQSKSTLYCYLVLKREKK